MNVTKKINSDVQLNGSKGDRPFVGALLNNVFTKAELTSDELDPSKLKLIQGKVI